MLIIEKTLDFQLNEKTAVVLGKFDGVHLGHQFLLEKLAMEKAKGLQTVVFTFDKSPASLFSMNGEDTKELCTLQEKRAIFEKLGVDVLIEFPMNVETAQISAEEFVEEYLQKRLNCECLIAGDDLRFGYKGLGTADMLKAHPFANQCRVDIYEKLPEISSTIIRDSIADGDIEKANKKLGYTYAIKGEVVHGMKLAGSALSMPTANVVFPEQKVLPRFGVYFTRAKVDGVCYNAITNVGQKPTVVSDTKVLAETYLYDFTGDLYGKEMTIYFEMFSREEVKFTGIEELKKQLQKDLEKGKQYWGSKQ